MSFLNGSIAQLREHLKSRRLKCRELIAQSFAQLAYVEPKIKATLLSMKEAAFEKADYWDRQLDSGTDVPALVGIPIAVKDNINIKGFPTTCASKILEGYTSPYDATVVERLAANGLIPVVKTNMDEFAMGSSNENSAFYPVKNPWNLDHVPGGSSGGSAAIVAAGVVPCSLGSDTGGSIRQPAAFCGLTGMKPTYGWVSRYGLVAFASSLDQIGPFTRSAEDMAYIMNAIVGHDVRDSTSSLQGVPDFTKDLNRDVKGLRIGVPKALLGDMIDEDVKEKVLAALAVFVENGATWETVDLSSIEEGVSTYYILAPAEASANLARFDGVRYGRRASDSQSMMEMYCQSRGEGFGPEVKRRILLGTYVLSSGYYDAYYVKAQKARAWISQEFEKAFSNYDVIMTPTTPSTAFKLGENKGDPLKMYLADIATIPVNLAGLPGISIPCGFADGLPVGLQLIGPKFSDHRLLQVSAFYQSLTTFHLERPDWIGAQL